MTTADLAVFERASARHRGAPAAEGAAPHRTTNGHDGTGPAPASAAPSPAAEAQERMGQRDKLLAVVAVKATIWADADGEAYATCQAGGHLEHWPVRSRGFRQWLGAAYAAEPAYRREVGGREVPGSVSKQAMEDALCNLQAWARFDNAREHEARLRCVAHAGRVYIDLGGPTWAAVEVAASGWRVIARPPVPILRSRKAHALPVPAARGDLSALWRFLPVAEADRPLAVMWMLAALYPQKTYPILDLAGAQGSGKSTATRVVRRLTDPAGGDLLQPPRNDRDLVAAARNNWVLAFDNVSGVSAETADDLCRLSTGAEVGGRALYSDHDTATFAAARPIVLNGIPDLATRGDLASRMLVPQLEPLGKRVDETTFWQGFDAAAPAVMAALLHGLSTALRNWPSTPTPQGHRMADFARMASAAAPAFGWDPGGVARRLADNARSVAAKLVESDPVAVAVMAILAESGRYEGQMGALYERARAKVDDDTRRSGDWPKAARHFGSHLRRVIPGLRVAGISVSERQKDGRTWVEIRCV